MHHYTARAMLSTMSYIRRAIDSIATSCTRVILTRYPRYTSRSFSMPRGTSNTGVLRWPEIDQVDNIILYLNKSIYQMSPAE